MSDFGHVLLEIQKGKHPGSAKVLKGFGRTDVVELIQRDKAGTFRAVYTVRFSDAVVVLHIFQKKSNKGIATPKHEIDLIKDRLKQLKEMLP